MDLPPLCFHASMEEQWDEEEEPEEIGTVLKVVPPAYSQYLDLFSKEKEEKLPPHHTGEHHIKLDGLLPPIGVIYSLSNHKKRMVAFLFVLTMANSILSLGKTGNLFSPMNHLLTLFNGSTIFSKIALCGAYNILTIKEGDEHLTAFRTKYNSYEYLVIPFALTNSPASFLNLVNYIFAYFMEIFVLVYLDDIMVFSSSEEGYIRHVYSVLKRLRVNNLVSKASKCVFHASIVEYLGYAVSSDGLKIDSPKVQQIVNWPQPKNNKALQYFLGFANFYHCFIKNHPKKINALTSLLKKDSPFIFNGEAMNQFQILKEAFTTAPLLSHFNPSLPAIVETNASDCALGAVLSQVNDSGMHPIAFDSCNLLPDELDYEIHDKELLGIVWALKCLRSFLLSLSNPFEVFTDHSSLQYFMSSRFLTHCQADWAEFLSEFHFTITYLPDRKTTSPNAFSPWDDVYPERGWTSSARILKVFIKLSRKMEFNRYNSSQLRWKYSQSWFIRFKKKYGKTKTTSKYLRN
ncbi:hypothetical protein O181_009611 [Austropuccinia psidii MF-1]|uniref:Reverse transcriptase domain-containing protein n=1 Tax=Austropuccinia psidii MF-1 TaxID=1389203 RepID=A0A9Q3BS63_9BASI|nr:hypothetical protein [Austropuccinia psidii MF-1]